MIKNGLLPGLALVMLLALTSCYSVPESIDEDLSINEYFQKAQEAVVEHNDFETALFYYNTFKERYPEEYGRIVEADYEIGFIYYKKEQYEEAKKIFEDVLDRYTTANAGLYPEWPKILSEKLLNKIEEKQNPSQKEEPVKDEESVPEGDVY